MEARSEPNLQKHSEESKQTILDALPTSFEVRTASSK